MKVLAILFLVFITDLSVAQILINEVSSAGFIGFADEDNDVEDWIEFYNPTGSPINLQGYKLINAEDGESKSWTFPNITIQPNDFLTVFCSGKNRNTWFDHWEVPVYANNLWRYFIGGIEPPTDWREISFNDSGWLLGAGGIGYGDGDDSTVVPAVNSIYMRKSFTVADTSKIPIAALIIDFDDAFVAYLNGIEIARQGIGVYGDRPAYNVSAYDEHEAQMYQTGNFSAGYYISPNVIDSALKPGTNVFSIQTHNYSGGFDDLSCIAYFLIGVNDASVTYYPFPADVHLHTSFNLNSSGQTISLQNPSGTTIDMVTIEPMLMNNSRGRSPDGNAALCLFISPTPDTSNTSSVCYLGYANKPDFNLNAGFYSGTQNISLSCSTPGLIKYTLNGDDPVLTSLTYVSPIPVDSNTVVRCRLFPFDGNYLPGLIATNTYFIDESISLPVVSLTSDNYNLFDWNYGIYVFGPNADMANVPYMGANFWQGWERPANIEFFDKNKNEVFEISSGIKIQGNFSKAWPQRGFSVKAKDNYGGVAINYQLFKDKPWINEFKSFNIRNAGSDWNTCHMRDRLNQKIAQSSHVETMAGFPCVLFINGMYWGVYEIREKQDDNYIENNSGINGNNIDFLQFDGAIITGTNSGFIAMANFIAGNDMSMQSNYDSASSLLDIENFCDYFITETYVINIDWLGSYTNNIKFWRSTNPPGKWRYVLWDTDLSLGFLPSYGGNFDTDMLDVAIHPPTPNPHSLMLESLLNNTSFKNYFVNRYADLMNTTLQPQNYANVATSFKDEMYPEMSRHFNLWGGTSPMPGLIGRSNDVAQWELNIDSMLLFAENRLPYARYYIQQQFGLIKQVNVELNSAPTEAGLININTILPESLPWSGIYYDGVPITLTAKPNPGYRFLYWQSERLITNQNSNISVTLNVDSNDVFTAHYEKIENYFDAYPNPFDQTLTIVYDVPSNQQAELILYDAIGRKSKLFFTYNQFQTEGRHELFINENDLPHESGFYFLTYKTESFSKTIKLIRSKL